MLALAGFIAVIVWSSRAARGVLDFGLVLIPALVYRALVSGALGLPADAHLVAALASVGFGFWATVRIGMCFRIRALKQAMAGAL